MNSSPRILVYGAGAIGSFLGALLAAHGADVTLLARGAHADAMRASGGLRVRESNEGERHVPVAVRRPGEAHGPYDLVFVTLKSMQLADAAADMMRLTAADGALVMVQNGMPWWYFHGVEHPLRGTELCCLDPQGELARTIDLQRVIGAVIYRPATLLAPGVLSAPPSAQRLVIGELDGHSSERCTLIAALVGAAGLPVEVTTDIRAAKWQKLLVNLLWNPLTALTQCTPDQVGAFAPARELVATLLREGAAVAAAVGVQLSADVDAELRRSAANFTPPSMLQDVRTGRALELDAIVHAVVEVADLCRVSVPALRTIATCAALLDERIRRDRLAIAPAPLA